jgi:hypothetical protein
MKRKRKEKIVLTYLPDNRYYSVGMNAIVFSFEFNNNTTRTSQLSPVSCCLFRRQGIG